MRIRISPDVCIAEGLRLKLPGSALKGENVELVLTEEETAFKPPYQRLLHDAMLGVGDLFGRQDIVDAQWRIVEPVLDENSAPIPYARGSWGPDEADQLIGSDGPWHNPLPPAPRP